MTQDIISQIVKPLEWAEFNEKGISVETPIGVEYKIDWGWQNGQYRLTDGDKSLWFITLEAAQAAAQADYRARIASALDLDALQALIAAAYEGGVRDAARRYDCGSGPDSWDYFATAKAAILDLLTTPTDATAALARMLADARAEGLGGLLMVEWIDEVDAVCRRYKIKTPSFRSAVSDLIRAMKEEQV